MGQNYSMHKMELTCNRSQPIKTNWKCKFEASILNFTLKHQNELSILMQPYDNELHYVFISSSVNVMLFYLSLNLDSQKDFNKWCGHCSRKHSISNTPKHILGKTGS